MELSDRSQPAHRHLMVIRLSHIPHLHDSRTPSNVHLIVQSSERDMIHNDGHWLVYCTSKIPA